MIQQAESTARPLSVVGRIAATIAGLLIATACADQNVVAPHGSEAEATRPKPNTNRVQNSGGEGWYCGTPKPEEENPPIMAESRPPGVESAAAGNAETLCTVLVLAPPDMGGGSNWTTIPQWPATPKEPWPDDGGRHSWSPLIPAGPYDFEEAALCPPSWEPDVPRSTYCVTREPNTAEMQAFQDEADLLANAVHQICRDLGAEIQQGLSNIVMTAGQIYTPQHLQSAGGQYIPPSDATQNRWEIQISLAWLEPADPTIASPRPISDMVRSVRHEFLHRMGIHHNPYNQMNDTYYIANTYCAPGGGGRGQAS